ncbi:MAG: helix-turn-helix domain-containing protein, partial [Halomonas aquamarina]
MTTVHRAYRYRFYPTSEQADQLARTFGCVRYVYNHFLRQRTDAWFEHQERMGYNATAKALTT